MFLRNNESESALLLVLSLSCNVVVFLI